MRPVAAPLLGLCLVLLLACSPPVRHPGEHSPPPSTSRGPAGAGGGTPPTTPWENPGGMWMPEQIPAQGDTLRMLGFTLDPAALAAPTGTPLGAIVSLGGCSGSFVSRAGLIATNHHCVTGALQFNSTPARNLLQHGYLARSSGEELPAGPTARVYVTRTFRDVTQGVRAGIDAIADDLARYRTMAQRQKQLVMGCERDRPGMRCVVVSFFGGERFILVERLALRDVRLVYAPPEGIGNYGGEVDNWRWPRHAGDFAFLRAYANQNNEPADSSTANTPYRPPRVLELAERPLRSGDPVLVAGYPARTQRLATAAEVNAAVAWELPYTADFCQTFLAELERLAQRNPQLAIQAQPTIRGLANWLTNTRGQLDGLVRGGLAQRRANHEAALQRWIAADPVRSAQLAGAIEGVTQVWRSSQKSREADAAVHELKSMVSLFRAAHDIVRNAEERPKPDGERDPLYQDRNQSRLVQSFQRLTKSYAPELDRAMLTLVTLRELERPPAQRAGIAQALLGAAAAKPTRSQVEAAIAKLYTHTRLDQEAVRLRWLQRGSLRQLQASGDSLLALALTLRPQTRAAREREQRRQGAMALVRPRYAAALRAYAGQPLAPDANGTLRVSYGTVRGYSPRVGAPEYRPFTTLAEVVRKHTGTEPFAAPAALRAAAARQASRRHVDADIGDVPVNFLADLDITGGNSGSPTLNARGRLVGLAFDGNYESIASDWLFIPRLTRSIHVDLRYLLWVLEAVSGGERVLAEMGVGE